MRNALRMLSTVAVATAAVAAAMQSGPAATAAPTSTSTMAAAPSVTAAGWNQVSAYCTSSGEGTACVAVDRSGSQYRARFSLKPASGHYLTPVGWTKVIPETGGPDNPFCSSRCSAVAGLWVATKPLNRFSMVKFAFNTRYSTQTLYTGYSPSTGSLVTCRGTSAGSVCAGYRYYAFASKGRGYDSFTALVGVHPTGGRWIAPEYVRLFAGSTTFFAGNFCTSGCVRRTTAYSWGSRPVTIAFGAFPKSPTYTAFKASAYGSVVTVLGPS